MELVRSGLVLGCAVALSTSGCSVDSNARALVDPTGATLGPRMETPHGEAVVDAPHTAVPPIPEVAKVALACGAGVGGGYEPVFFGKPTPNTPDTPMELAHRFAVRLGHSHATTMTPHEVTRSASTVVIRFDDPAGSVQGAMQFEQTNDSWELTHLDTCPGPPESFAPPPSITPQLVSE